MRGTLRIARCKLAYRSAYTKRAAYGESRDSEQLMLRACRHGGRKSAGRRKAKAATASSLCCEPVGMAEERHGTEPGSGRKTGG
ncbi:MAG: hypothetical protein ACI4HQ_05765 [Acetatifactor sp.]